ncbi:MAG: polysaccharide deacetylase family protein [Clostridiales bacterium]|nr:polysaccharide deacetylase family protein [Clostridiales bacterium]
MFLVFHKNKIVSIILLIILSVTSIFIFSNKDIQTSATAKKQLPIYMVDTQEKKVALTLNCAWANDDISSILDTLDKYNVKLTFFVVGDWVDKYPESVKQIYSAGHEIANHSNTHPHVNKLSYEQNINEINSCSNKVKNITGKPTTLYRGPYGEYNNTVIEAANSTNHQAIQWNIDTLDYKGLTKEEMYNRIEKNLCPGSIILMHSGAENTANALPYIIEKLIEKKNEIVTVSDLIYTDNFYIDIQGKQKLFN